MLLAVSLCSLGEKILIHKPWLALRVVLVFFLASRWAPEDHTSQQQETYGPGLQVGDRMLVRRVWHVCKPTNLRTSRNITTGKTATAPEIIVVRRLWGVINTARKDLRVSCSIHSRSGYPLTQIEDLFSGKRSWKYRRTKWSEMPYYTPDITWSWFGGDTMSTSLAGHCGLLAFLDLFLRLVTCLVASCSIMADFAQLQETSEAENRATTDGLHHGLFEIEKASSS